ncbi:MAG: hypothetical protein IPK75_00785 [Acidobacteria bacterium]|jgi:hypothetical protein|nr:hypothetical protein [Acidobacteriota bacterium]
MGPRASCAAKPIGATGGGECKRLRVAGERRYQDADFIGIMDEIEKMRDFLNRFPSGPRR